MFIIYLLSFQFYQCGTAVRVGGGSNYDSTSIQPPFNCTSTTRRPFDDLHYDRRPTCVGLLLCGL